jgi:hypothetical protein
MEPPFLTLLFFTLLCTCALAQEMRWNINESDEMEGRIEANLSTSSLYYGALETSISLAKAMGEEGDLFKAPGPQRKDLFKTWGKKRKRLARAIEQFFGPNVEGLDTYRYYEGHENLRQWFALPLVVGLHDCKEGSLERLFDQLWTDNGVHVEKKPPERRQQ